MTDQERVKMMEDMNWKPAAQYWKGQYDKAKAANPIKGELELEYDSDGIWLVYDSDGIWLVDVTYKTLPEKLGHIPWQIIATYIKEYLDD